MWNTDSKPLLPDSNQVKAQSAAAEAAAAAAVLQCDSSGVSSSIARLAEVVQVQHLQVVEQVQVRRLQSLRRCSIQSQQINVCLR